MSDASLTNAMKLDDALRALPLCAPHVSAWPAMAAQLSRTSSAGHSLPSARRYWKIAVPLTLAAGVVLFFAAHQTRDRSVPNSAGNLVATIPHRLASSSTSTANDANAAMDTNVKISKSQPEIQLAALQARSQALEGWLHETRRDGMPLPGQDLAAAAEIEDMIGLVDVQLAAPTRAPAIALWQRRVALLEDLTALRYSSYRQAETLAVADRSATVPAVWTH